MLTNNTFSCNICQVARRCYERKIKIDAWLSLVERCVRDAEVAGSNPVAIDSWQGRRSNLKKFRCSGFLLKRKKLRFGTQRVHKVRWTLELDRPKRKRRPQVQILSHRLLAGAPEHLKKFRCSGFLLYSKK